MLITNNRVDCFRNSRGQKKRQPEIGCRKTKTKKDLISVGCLSEVKTFTHIKFHDFHFENKIIFGL